MLNRKNRYFVNIWRCFFLFRYIYCIPGSLMQYCAFGLSFVKSLFYISFKFFNIESMGFF